MPIPIFVVDAFTNQPFQGNPAAVCLLSENAPQEWLQKIAMEMNLSETAFLLGSGDEFHLRWFTPTVEVDLCGHATLASAHVLWEKGLVPGEQTLHFQTRSGRLTATKQGEWIEMDFPTTVPEPASAPEGLLEAMGVSAVSISRSKFDYLIEVATAEEVRQAKPRFDLLSAVEARGIILTGKSAQEGYDFISRFFAPRVGVPEDPVTGSAHSALAPYWGKKLSKENMVGYQASARGGVVRVRVVGDRVILGGQAVTVLSGTLKLNQV